MKKQLNEQQNSILNRNLEISYFIFKKLNRHNSQSNNQNFESSLTKLLSLKILPDLDWSSDGQSGVDDFNVTKLSNIFLAPQLLNGKFSTCFLGKEMQLKIHERI